MKLLKKNQVIIYVIVLMLMTAGYLNFTTNNNKAQSVETSMQIESSDDMQIADIGDATLVSSNDVVINTSTDTTTKPETENIETENIETVSIETKNDNNNENDEYFTKSKLERETMYSQMLESYEKILNSSNSLETQKQTATQEIAKINETKNSIMICENLIKTKGFTKNVVFVNGDSINVIIGAESLEKEKIAQIQNIVSRELNAKIENIHISTK